MYLLAYMPFEKRKDNIMEVFNEFCVFIAIYHLIAFTELFYDPEMKFNVGFSLIAVVLL